MVVAAYLPKEVINKTQKLVLMKIADSADDQTRLGRPGLERMMAWAGVGEKQVITVVTELVGLGLVERIEVGRVGRRAEYRVFPHGVPPIPSTEELIEWRRAALRAPTNPRLARKVTRRKPSVAARTQDDVAAREEARDAVGRPPQEGLPRGNPEGGPERVAAGEPGRFPQGNREGSPGATPSLPSPSSFLPFPLPPWRARKRSRTPTRRSSRRPTARSTRWRSATAGGAERTRAPVANRRGGRPPRASTPHSSSGCGSSSPSSSVVWLRRTLRRWSWPASVRVSLPASAVRAETTPVADRRLPRSPSLTPRSMRIRYK